MSIPRASAFFLAHDRVKIEAVSTSMRNSTSFITISLTFEKLLTGILLEECFMNNRPGEVVNHKLEERLNFLLSIARVVSKDRIL